MRWSRSFHGLFTDRTKKTATSTLSEMAVIFEMLFLMFCGVVFPGNTPVIIRS